MDDDELRDVVDRAIKHDLTALSRLYDIYFDRVYRYILIRVRNVAEAEDLTSQTFLRMVERIDSFKSQPSGGGFGAWIFRIAHNLVVDWFRGRQPMGPLVEKDEPRAKGPEELVVEDESIRRILRGLGSLTGDQRQVVLLRLIGGLSCRETAGVIGTTEGNVRVLQHRAIQTLREKLEVTTNAW